MAAGGSEPAGPLRLGSVFGRYRVDALVGRGGMGVVFRATDLSLERPVALKVLSPVLAADPAFRARFVRESRLAAAIEHPAIVAVYEAGAIGDTLYLAMRFVPGRDLGTILRLEAPLGLERTLALLRPIADALDAAHRRGLVHRDVKPANVLVEPDGVERPYLADFGLTRRLGEATAATRAGPLGTIDYVAPEQVEGGAIDGRTDQYGLACVVVHCLTGAPPFERDSDASVLFAHVHAPPPRVSGLVAGLPATLDAVLARALAKAPAERFPDCRSFVGALAGAAPASASGTGAAGRATPPTPPTPPAAVGSEPRRAGGRWRRVRDRPRVALVLGAFGVAGAIVAGAMLVAPSPSRPTISDLDTATHPPSDPPSTLALLDGEVVVFASDRDGDFDIYAIDAARGGPRRLAATDLTERNPALAPDGRTIAYVVGDEPDRDIWLMDADGGRKRPFITHPTDDTDPVWSADGSMFAFSSRRSDPAFDIFAIRDRGDGFEPHAARNLTARPALEQGPAWSPSGQRIAIASSEDGGPRDIVIIDPDDADVRMRRTSTTDDDFGPAFAPDGGSILFARRNPCLTCPGLLGQADIYRVEGQGRPSPITTTSERDEVMPEWSPDGRAFVVSAGSPGEMDLYVISRDGRRRRPLTHAMADAIQPSWGTAPAPPRTRPGRSVATASARG